MTEEERSDGPRLIRRCAIRPRGAGDLAEARPAAFLIGGLATGAALSAPINYAAMARSKRIPLAKQVTFPQGVASGFPYPKGTILWTRAEGLRRAPG